MPRTRKAAAEDAKANDEKVDGEDKPRPVLSETKQGDQVEDETQLIEDGVEHFTIPFNDKEIACERRGDAEPALIFTHGAGGGLDAPASKEFANGFAEVSPIVSFQGTMNLKSRIKYYNAVMDHLEFDTALGGRSMGARAAAISSHEEGRETKALVLVSFPLIGASKKDSREQILLDLPEHIDVLFITGTQDSMCDLNMLEEVVKRAKPTCWFVTVEDADHGMSWKWKDSVEAMRRKTGAVAAEWLKVRDGSRRYSNISYDEDAKDVRCSDWAVKATNGESYVEGDASAGAKPEPPQKKRKSGKGKEP